MKFRRTLIGVSTLVLALGPGVALVAAPAGANAVCAYSTHGDVLWLDPLNITRINGLVASRGFASLGVNVHGSAVVMKISRPDPGTIAPNQTIVFLQTGPALRSDKALSARNNCTGAESVMYKALSSSSSPGRIFTRAAGGSSGIDTIEFHQPGFLGLWYQAAEWDPNVFWALAGGNSVVFDWQTD